MATALAGGLLLGAILNGSADRWPGVLASIWLSNDGEARLDGRIYRLLDEKGRTIHLGRRLCLTILDARPEAKR